MDLNERYWTLDRKNREQRQRELDAVLRESNRRIYEQIARENQLAKDSAEFARRHSLYTGRTDDMALIRAAISKDAENQKAAGRRMAKRALFALAGVALLMAVLVAVATFSL